MVQSPPPITSTLLSNAPSGLTLTLDLFITGLCVSTCRVILFILYCPLKKPSVHLRYLLSSERRTDKMNNYCACSTFSCKRARYFLQELIETNNKGRFGAHLPHKHKQLQINHCLYFLYLHHMGFGSVPL